MEDSKGRKRVVVLGATGSIGDSTLKVAHDIPDRIEIVGLAANSNVEKLAIAANKTRAKAICLVDERKMSILRSSTRQIAFARVLFAAIASFSTLLFAASPTISIRSGMSCATLSVLSPIEPVAPKTTTRLRPLESSILILLFRVY